jgi:hypothetical protein
MNATSLAAFLPQKMEAAMDIATAGVSWLRFHGGDGFIMACGLQEIREFQKGTPYSE